MDTNGLPARVTLAANSYPVHGVYCKIMYETTEANRNQNNES